MTPNKLKLALFFAGSLVAAAGMLTQLAAYSAGLVGIGGILVGWSGLRRPGDAPAVKS